MEDPQQQPCHFFCDQCGSAYDLRNRLEPGETPPDDGKRRRRAPRQLVVYSVCHRCKRETPLVSGTCFASFDMLLLNHEQAHEGDSVPTKNREEV